MTIYPHPTVIENAVGNGTHDDSELFLSDMGRAMSETGTLRAPKATYLIGQPLVLPPNLTFLGDGDFHTILRRKPEFTNGPLLVQSAGCRVSGIGFDDNYPARLPGDASVIDITGPSILENFRIFNPGFMGVNILSGGAQLINGDLDGGTSENEMGCGVWAADVNIGLTILDRLRIHSWAVGGAFAGADDMVISRSHFWGNHRRGGNGQSGGGHIAMGSSGTLHVSHTRIGASGGPETSGIEIYQGRVLANMVRILPQSHYDVFIEGGAGHRFTDLIAEGPRPFHCGIAAHLWEGRGNSAAAMNQVTVPPAAPVYSVAAAQDYLTRYPDVADAYGATNYPGAWDHYQGFGAAEGRTWINQ